MIQNTNASERRDSQRQLQVKGGTFSNEERWGIVGGMIKFLMQVKGGISSHLWLAESHLWLAPTRRWRMWISIVYITNTPPPPSIHHPSTIHGTVMYTIKYSMDLPTYPDNLPEPTDNLPGPTDSLHEPTCSFRILTKPYQAIPNHTMTSPTKFHNFDKISQF